MYDILQGNKYRPYPEAIQYSVLAPFAVLYRVCMYK